MARTRSLPLLLLLLLAAAALLLTPPASADADGDSDADDGDDDDGDDEGGDGPSLEEYGILELAEAAADPRSLVLGWRQYGDRLILDETVRRAKGFGRLHEVDVRVARGDATITHVVARASGDGGAAVRPERKAGGVGARSLHLRLRAPRGFGLHYRVRVYAKNAQNS